MKKKIKEKTAKRWLRRNVWKMSKLELGMGYLKRSCFHKQMILCQKIVGVK